MSRFLRCLAVLIISQTILAIGQAQTTTVIPANEAAAHINEYATVEGAVAKGIHQQERKHVPEYRRQLSKSGLYWDGSRRDRR
jgi:outer membrane lipoprotein-sorting protein